MYKKGGNNNQALIYLRKSKQINELKFELENKPIIDLENSFPQPNLVINLIYIYILVFTKTFYCSKSTIHI